MAITVGSLLAGRYEVTAPIAVGGMGEVWRARDQVLDRTVAAKVLRSEFTGDPNFLARFRNEARHTAALSHPNIASVYDYGETVDDSSGQKLAFLVMEFVDGQPLVTILHEEGRLPVDWTLHVVGQAADGLSAAHRAGVVHRDIKPGNLMVRPDGMVKLTDFGIAQARDATPLTRTGMVVGTAQYLSPEQAQGFPVTASSDVYSLGVVAYECLTGVRPFDGTSQVAVALAHINRPAPPLPPEVPPDVRALIGRALAKDPSQRFPDGGAFADAIRNVASGLPMDGGGSASTHPGGPRTGGTLGGGALAGGALAGGALAAAAAADGSSARTGTTQVLGDVGASRTQVLGTGAVAAAGGRHAAGEPATAPRPMPPLHGPPVDDGLPPDEYPEERDGRRRWLWLAAGLAVLLLLGLGTWLLLSSSGGSPQATRTTSPPPTSTAAKTVFIDTNAYIGRPATDVTDELRGKGLATVTTQPASTAQLQEAGRALQAGDVVTTAPVNQMVPLTASVTLFVAPRNYEPNATSAAPTTSQAPRTTAAPVTTAAPPPTTAAPTTTRNPGPTASSTAPGTVITSTAATQQPQAGPTP